jgi:gamma-glutamylcyclotransferase (GGCT)/AIG2-like uncharacterized protein YtfP
MDKTLLFVYGTLRPRDGKSRYKTIGSAIAKGQLFNVGGWFPGAKFDGRNTIYGDVLEVSEAELYELDRYEGYRDTINPRSRTNLYYRTKTTVQTEDNQKIEVWTYEYNHAVDPAHLIATGDWYDH